MKDQTQVEERLRRLVRDALDKHMASFDEKLPHKCHHNHRQPLDHRKTIYGETNPSYNRISAGRDDTGAPVPVMQTLGLCMYGASSPNGWKGDICEDPIDAQRCPVYNPIKTKEALYAEFMSNASSEEWLKENHPECWSLLWVLGVGLAVKLPPPEEPPPPAPSLFSALLGGLRSGWQEFWHPFKKTTPALPALEGPPADLTVYVPSLEEYEDHRAGTSADHREAP